jgi:diguanylate cyclase (GGDEF)-like protein
VAGDLRAVRQWVLAALIFAAAALALVGLLAVYFHQRRRYLARIVEASLRDPLTGLYTRAYMADAVAALEALQDRGEGVVVALVMFDLDHFKRVNDIHGHRAGDAVLRETGRIIREESRDTDIPVRYGGEEIAAFLSVHRLDEALHFAERVSQRMRELRHFEKWSLSVTVSAGVALRRPFESLPHLIERADRLLYMAKRAGRDRVITGESGVLP